MTIINPSPKIEVITSVQRRRRFTPEQKLRLVAESQASGMSVSAVARNHGISPSQLFQWRRRMEEGSREAIRADDDVVSAGEVRELKKRIRELERALGRRTLEIDILKDALELAHEKKLIARLPSLPSEDMR